jgi:hypothetical protein
MYKIEVSWYYRKSKNGRLQLSGCTRKVNIDHGLDPGLDNCHRSNLTSVDYAARFGERRESPRLKSDFEAQVIADLSILDVQSHSQSPPLVFLGRVINVSLGGLGLILPSLLLDERFCGSSNLMELSLYLPNGAALMTASPVRCSPLSASDRGQGYFVGARINTVWERRDEFERYLNIPSTRDLNN